MELYLPVAGFRAGIEDFKKQIEELGKRPVADEAEMQQCKNDLQSVKQSAADYIITNSSKDIGPELAGSIRSENDFQVPGNRSLAEQTRKFRERCESRLHALDAALLTIDASDPLVEGRSFAEERADLTVEEKQEFLLLKLYQLRKASGYWEAADIFRHNQVGMDNYGEVRGICEELEYGGLIDVLGTLGSYAVRITPQGKKNRRESHSRTDCCRTVTRQKRPGYFHQPQQ